MLIARWTLCLATCLFPAIASATDLQVLFFTQNGCPPCRVMEPDIDRLSQSGIPVVKIHLETHGEYARQCGIAQTPSVIVVDGNRVLARHTGVLGLAELERMVAPWRPIPGEEASGSNDSATSPAAFETSSASPESGDTAELRALKATVRLRISDPQGTGVATGTIIHRKDEEALVLTCGHAFRESGGNGEIDVEIGFGSESRMTVKGALWGYDADKHDVALVLIPCPLPIEPVPVSPEVMHVEAGDRAFTVGCDQGADPSLRETTLKSLSRYSGVEKYDIVGRPVYGRSGGGLFTSGGQLIGVCNAQAVNEDEGIYAGLESIYWQFAAKGISHVFRSRSAAEPANAEMHAQNSQATIPTRLATVRTGDEGEKARPQSSHPEAFHAVFTGDQPPASNAAWQSQSRSTELIVVIRDAGGGGSTETLEISNPSPELLDQLRRFGDSGSSPAAPSGRTSQMPELAPVTRRGDTVRGQSPR
jgi:Trypsin-like peptidase domain/Thioredoxin